MFQYLVILYDFISRNCGNLVIAVGSLTFTAVHSQWPGTNETSKHSPSGDVTWQKISQMKEKINRGFFHFQKKKVSQEVSLNDKRE